MLIIREFTSFLNIIMGIFIYLIQFTSYLLTVLINQGYPSKNKNNDIINNHTSRVVAICSVCKLENEMGNKIVHCYECDICVEGSNNLKIGFDHHCPWTSKCIGKGNIKYFYLFLAMTLVLFFYMIISVINYS